MSNRRRRPSQRRPRPRSRPDRREVIVDHRPGCARPDKRHFLTAHDALISRASDAVSHGHLEPYRCDCGRWCLTSHGSRS